MRSTFPASRTRRSLRPSARLTLITAAAVAALAAVLGTPTAGSGRDSLGLGVAEAAAARGLGVIMVVRHAEKASGEDPPLSDAGQLRAKALASLLKELPIRRLIASDLRRTRETLAPLAEAKGIRIERTPSQPEAEAAAAVARKLRTLGAGEFAVVAHHSFTIQAILAQFDWKVGAPRDHEDIWLLFLDDGKPVGHLALRVPGMKRAAAR